MNGKNNWYTINNINEIDSPALVVYIDRVKENISTLINMIDDVSRLRPHVKTHKIKEATLLLIEAGVNKFKCATIAEAEMLGMCSAKDVLLAYQPIGPKLKRFVDVIKKYPQTKYSCLVDNKIAAEEMNKVFAENNLTVNIFIDLNVGQNRTGIVPGDEALDLYIYCASLKNIKPIGLHAYDGHIRDVDFDARKQKCDEAFLLVEKMQQQLKLKGFAEPIIIAGGSPTFSIHSKRKNIECSPGTFIFWDKGYLDLCPEQNFIPAALVITRIISLPTKITLCLDLGHKSVAAENAINKRVYFLNAPELKAAGQSEEHLIVEAGENHHYKVGDILYGLPIHICPTIALYERAIVIENNTAKGEWRIIARDRKITV